MPPFSDSAVVLRRLDYSETSQILVLFTRNHGKLRTIAKGIKRGTKTRFATAIDLLEVGRVVWSARAERQQNLAILTEWKQVRSFAGLRDSLDRLYVAQYAGEVTCELTADNDPHPELFDALVSTLDETAVSDQPLIELCQYQRSLLVEIGLMPRGDACVGCHRALAGSEGANTYFSSREGGLLCRDCESGQAEKRLVRLAVAQAVFGGRVSGPAAAEAFDLLNYHISHLMHKGPKLAEFIVPGARRRQLGPPPT